MSIEDFNHTIDAWIDALQRYSIEDLTTKPSPDSWSMGQLYNHIIDETKFYMGRITICIQAIEILTGKCLWKAKKCSGTTPFRMNV